MELNFNEKYILQDEHVLLRPLELLDVEHLSVFAANEPDLWKFSAIKVSGVDDLRSYIDMTISARKENREYPFIVFDKRNGKYVGSTRFYDIQLVNKTLQLGYTWYGKEFQGTGLNKHCKFLLLQFAFEELGMERVEFRADNTNIRSIAAMKSIGCVEEGVLRNHVPLPDGRRRDSIILSMLKEEWSSKSKDALFKKLK